MLVQFELDVQGVDALPRTCRPVGLCGDLREGQLGLRARLGERLPHVELVLRARFGERLGENRLQLEGFYRTFGERMREIDGGRVVLFSALPEARWLLNLDEIAVGKPRFWKFNAGDLDAWLMRWDLPYSGYQPSERTPKAPRAKTATSAGGGSANAG